MKIGFIGAGKVGISYGKYLVDHNVEVVGYYSRSVESAMKAAAFTESRCFYDLQELLDSADIIFITTPDDVINRIAQEITNLNIKKGQVFAHMSGGCSSEELKPIGTKGCLIASLHPLQAFAEIDKALANLNKTVFSLEGDIEAISIIETIIKKCGNSHVIIPSDKKSLYHSAACVVSNYLVTILAIGEGLLDAAGIDKEVGIEALLPLIYSSIDNVKALGTADAITGPIVRGDINTLKGHLKAINKYCPELLGVYSCLGVETLNLATVNKLKNKETIEEIKKLWRDGNE